MEDSIISVCYPYALKQNTMKNGAFSSAMFMRVEEVQRKGNRDWITVRKRLK